MTQDLWTAVDTYVDSSLSLSDDALRATVAANAEGGLPSIDVTASQGMLLHLLARAIGAKRVLEIGTLGGYSTIWLARALPDGGRVVTLEFDPKHAAVAKENIERAGLASIVDVRVGKALDSLPVIEREGPEPFDLLFIDADKVNNPNYFEWALKLTHAGSLIIVDNVVREGGLADSLSEDAAIRASRAVVELMGRDPRVEATVMQTVGAKGYDGFAIALVV
jgi:predicted O-methyltransferase YrrM